MNKDVPVVIFCGGAGTRLREETEFKPKPMVTIGNRPILWHIMKIYAHYGFKKFILCLGYKREMIKEYFYHYEIVHNDVIITLGRNSNFQIFNGHDEEDWQIILSDTGDNAYKGARLKRIQKYIGSDELMVTYGDGVTDIDINNLLTFHRAHGKIATVTGVRPKFLRFAELETRSDHVTKFTEKPQNNGNYINGGFFVFKRKIFDYLEDRDNCDLEVGTLEEISKAGELMIYKHDKFWACMDTLRDVEYLNNLWNSRQAAWKIWQ